jgi:hypothetical protein
MSERTINRATPKKWTSNEFFVEHPDGSRSDAELHGPILAAGDHDAATDVTRNWLREQGYSAAEIEAFLGNPTQSSAADRALAPSPVLQSSTVYLVSCVGKKQDQACKASELYASQWFLKARAYVESTRCSWFILSAEYGLLAPDRVVKPYDKTLNHMNQSKRREWATRVIAQMDADLPPADRIVILAGKRYREFLTGYLRRRAGRVDVPMEGLAIGKQLQFLQRGSTDAGL